MVPLQSPSPSGRQTPCAHPRFEGIHCRDRRGLIRRSDVLRHVITPRTAPLLPIFFNCCRAWRVWSAFAVLLDRGV